MKKINESFVCINCGRHIPPAKKTCRNHCPYCFTSVHLDDKIPGDRASNCNGKMLPREYFISNQEIKIAFECEKCGKIHYNKASLDDDLANLDNMIIKYKY